MKKVVSFEKALRQFHLSTLLRGAAVDGWSVPQSRNPEAQVASGRGFVSYGDPCRKEELCFQVVLVIVLLH